MRGDLGLCNYAALPTPVVDRSSGTGYGDIRANFGGAGRLPSPPAALGSAHRMTYPAGRTNLAPA